MFKRGSQYFRCQLLKLCPLGINNKHSVNKVGSSILQKRGIEVFLGVKFNNFIEVAICYVN